jgi:hypothetical protein
MTYEATPSQGRWRISGIELPDSILHKVYNRNAARLMTITMLAIARAAGRFE